MISRKTLLLASTFLIAAGCAHDGDGTGLAPLEEEDLGVFGLPVGEPVDVISATKGDGVSFDKFQVTFNNAEGTDITITTPEGEEINFTEADLEWAGYDPNLGIDVARLTSARGDRLDVTLGTNYVLRTEDADDAEYETDLEGELVEDDEGNPICIEGTGCAGELMEVPVVAAARLDESDTREGFETYAVVGMETDPENLARYQEDQEGAEYEMDEDGEFVLDDDGNMICVAGSGCAGELAEGDAWYWGGFVASVSRRGENVSDTVNGDAAVNIDFANNGVAIYLEGGYYADDVDDRANAVTGVSTSSGTAVTSVSSDTVYPVGNVWADHTEVADDVLMPTAIPPCALGCVGVTFPSPVWVVEEVNHYHIAVAGPVSTTTGSFVTNVYSTTENDNSDFYYVGLYGFGSSTDLDLGFDGSVQYTGLLTGGVQVPSDNAGIYTDNVYVAGTFGGAVFGAGAAAASDAGDFYEVTSLTSTAGVFQADSGHTIVEGDDGPELAPVDDSAGVDITGAYIAGPD